MVLKFALIALVLNAACVIGFSTSGNKILNSSGKEVILRGVDRPSLEWSASGQDLSLSDYELMASWGANIVRLSLNQDFWLSGSSSYSSSYKSTVAQQVTWARSAGLAIILDLHWSDQGNLDGTPGQQTMPDANSVTFWTQVATIYKNEVDILFELYNEPNSVSWSIWRNGGNTGSFNAVGLQTLYNTVRATGAENVVIVNGLNWAFDLSGVGDGYAITGTNIAYGTHPYDYSGKQSAQWPAAFGYLASTYPVILTEFGQFCNSDSYVQDLLEYAQSLSLHWTAWAWFVNGCSFPSIISDWNGTPLAPAGPIVKSYLSASKSSGSTSTTGSSSSTNWNVYTDSLQNGWENWSWSTNNFENTSPVYSGSDSISFVPSNYGAIYFHNPTSFSVGTYASLQFYIRGSLSSGESFGVLLYGTGSSPSQVGSTVSLPSALESGTWVKQTISLSSFGESSSTQITGFAIQFRSGNTASTYYVDSVVFV